MAVVENQNQSKFDQNVLVTRAQQSYTHLSELLTRVIKFKIITEEQLKENQIANTVLFK